MSHGRQMCAVWAVLAIGGGCLPPDRAARASDTEAEGGETSDGGSSSSTTTGDDSGVDLLGFDEDEVLDIAANFETQLVRVNRDPEPGTHGDAAEINFWAHPSNLELFKTIDPELPDQTVVFIEGAMFVKQHLDPAGATIGHTVMVKARPGYNPDAGDWWWARISEGRLTHSGIVGFCVDCHRERAAPTDYVLGVAMDNRN